MSISIKSGFSIKVYDHVLPAKRPKEKVEDTEYGSGSTSETGGSEEKVKKVQEKVGHKEYDSDSSSETDDSEEEEILNNSWRRLAAMNSHFGAYIEIAGDKASKAERKAKQAAEKAKIALENFEPKTARVYNKKAKKYEAKSKEYSEQKKESAGLTELVQDALSKKARRHERLLEKKNRRYRERNSVDRAGKPSPELSRIVRENSTRESQITQ